MVTVALSGRLGYLPKTKEVGLLLEPSTGKVIAECGILVLKLRGSVIGKLSPTNTETTKFKLEYRDKAGEEYKPTWSHFEGEETLHIMEASVLGGSYTEAALATTPEISSAEALEIKA